MNGGGRNRLRGTGRRLARLPLLGAHLLLGVLIAAALGPGRTRHYRSTAPLAWWSRGLCRIMGMRVCATGTPYRGAALFVANHVSWLDIFCIAAVCPTHFLSKHEVAAWPLFGWLCRRAGTAFIRRGGAGGAGEATEQLTRRLRRGGRVLVFPEGTSTDGTSVRRFYPRLFHAALLAGCPVQAIALQYPRAGGLHPNVPFINQDTLLPHLWRLLGEPTVNVLLRFGTVHNPPYPSRDLLAKKTQSEVEALLRISPARWPATGDRRTASAVDISSGDPEPPVDREPPALAVRGHFREHGSRMRDPTAGAFDGHCGRSCR